MTAPIAPGVVTNLDPFKVKLGADGKGALRLSAGRGGGHAASRRARVSAMVESIRRW